MEITNSIGLTWKFVKDLERRDLHATIDGCRAIVDWEGYVYQVDVKPLFKVPLQANTEELMVAPDGSC